MPTLLSLASASAFAACAGGEPSTGTGPITGSLKITVATTGQNQDPDGYTVSIDGGAAKSLGTNAETTVAELPAGSHSVQLAGLAANCSLAGDNPRSAAVQAGATTTVALAVTCTAPSRTGTISVTIQTTGTDIDADGYIFAVDTAAAQTIAVNGTQQVTGAAVGAYDVVLLGLAANCSVAQENPVRTNVIVDGTTTVAFAVTCSPIQPGPDTRIVFSSDFNSLKIVDPDGSDVRWLVWKAHSAMAPRWSPDHSKVTFTWADDVDRQHIATIRADGTGLTVLPTGGRMDDNSPSFSPDGQKIAYIGDGDVWVMNADGSNRVQAAPSGIYSNLDPTWSPDGTKIAYVEADSGWNIYTVRPDGSERTALTFRVEAPNVVFYYPHPAWSPDGARIAFTKRVGERLQIAVMNADGTGETVVSDGQWDDELPSWSPDGTKLVFQSKRSGVGTSKPTVFVMNADGSNVHRLTTTIDVYESLPSWSR